jgi:hypothetical protein
LETFALLAQDFDEAADSFGYDALASMAAAAALAASQDDHKIQTGNRKNPLQKKPRLPSQIRFPPRPKPSLAVLVVPA